MLRMNTGHHSTMLHSHHHRHRHHRHQQYHHQQHYHDHHHLPGADQPRRGSWRPRPGKDEEVQRLPQGKNHYHHHRPHPHNHIFLTFNPGQICSRVLISVWLATVIATVSGVRQILLTFQLSLDLGPPKLSYFFWSGIEMSKSLWCWYYMRCHLSFWSGCDLWNRIGKILERPHARLYFPTEQLVQRNSHLWYKKAIVSGYFSNLFRFIVVKARAWHIWSFILIVKASFDECSDLKMVKYDTMKSQMNENARGNIEWKSALAVPNEFQIRSNQKWIEELTVFWNWGKVDIILKTK